MREFEDHPEVTAGELPVANEAQEFELRLSVREGDARRWRQDVKGKRLLVVGGQLDAFHRADGDTKVEHGPPWVYCPGGVGPGGAASGGITMASLSWTTAGSSVIAPLIAKYLMR
jgi:hypothetical protein